MAPTRNDNHVSFHDARVSNRWTDSAVYGPKWESNVIGWQQVLPGVYLWPDSCNVYGIVGPTGVVIVNAGTGAWIDHVADLPALPRVLACTHFFRDHSAGAARAAHELGLPVFVPEREADLFSDPLEHFRGRPTYLVYKNYWDHFVPIEPIPVAGVLRDYERIGLAGLQVDVVPLPGATVNQVGLAFTVPGTSLRAVCSGETIHSPGRVPRVAPLQYNLRDLAGAVEVWHSAETLRRLEVDVLLPSLGTPIVSDADGALAELQRSIEAICATRPIESGRLGIDDRPVLTRVSEHVWLSRRTLSSCAFVVGPAGKALAIDYGYHDERIDETAGFTAPTYRARVLAHTLDGLREQAGVECIDVVIASHYHDDHVAGIPLLQRTQGTKCWAHEAFADLLAYPDAHQFPCANPIPTRIDRRVNDTEVADWEGIGFRFRAASGHTRFENMIGFEVDGIKYAHSGDQYGFVSRSSLERHVDEWRLSGERITDWASVVGMNNHIYRCGAQLDSFARSGAWLKEWRPDVVLSGHWPAFQTDQAFFDLIDEGARFYEESHTRLMPLGADDTHFNVDSWAGWLCPYRLHLAEGETGTVRATVRNPYPHEASIDVRLVGSTGWVGSSATLTATARAEVSCDLRITPDGPCRRRPIAIELVADGRPFGQVAEALVTVGGSAW
jgi:glyoxylase-like metal-dependent hydrolase (beta-lactamase superfamily II)